MIMHITKNLLYHTLATKIIYNWKYKFLLPMQSEDSINKYLIKFNTLRYNEKSDL